MADRLNAQEIFAGISFPTSNGLAEDALTTRAGNSLESGKLREFWKYTKVNDFIVALTHASVHRAQLDGLDQPGIEVQSLGTDGLQRVPYPLGPSDAASSERFPLADLSLLMCGDLLIIRINATLAQPLRVRFQDGLSVPLLFLVAPGVKAKILEENRARQFSNHSIYIQLGEGAELIHASTALIVSTSHWSLTQVVQSANSQYRRQQYQCGGAKRRTETQVLLSGRGAETLMRGAYLVDEGSHLDQQLVVEHRAPGTRSRQKFHGIGNGHGTAVFNGRIHIHPGAPGSDAELSNKNLALHPGAIINTKPELEIYTDDVKCAHGATIGQISEDSLFYLQSRGLSAAQSKHILCRAFIKECIEGDLADVAAEGLLGSWS